MLTVFALAFTIASTPASGSCSPQAYQWEVNATVVAQSEVPEVTLPCRWGDVSVVRSRAVCGAEVGPWSEPSEPVACLPGLDLRGDGVVGADDLAVIQRAARSLAHCTRQSTGTQDVWRCPAVLPVPPGGP